MQMRYKVTKVGIQREKMVLSLFVIRNMFTNLNKG